MGGFEVLEHTADIGIKACAASAEETLINVALGMFSILTDTDTVDPKQEIAVEVEAPDREALLHDWLEELLFQSQTRNMLFSRFVVHRLEENRLRASAYGEPLDPEKHPLKLEIKAATYHQLKFGPAPAGWEATVIFDV